MHNLIFFEYLYLGKGSLLSEAYFTGFGAKNQFTKIIPYFILFLLLQLTHSHWNFENPWSLQGSEAKRRFCLHLGQASTSRPAGTIICLGDKICGSSNIVCWHCIFMSTLHHMSGWCVSLMTDGWLETSFITRAIFGNWDQAWAIFLENCRRK